MAPAAAPLGVAAGVILCLAMETATPKISSWKGEAFLQYIFLLKKWKLVEKSGQVNKWKLGKMNMYCTRRCLSTFCIECGRSPLDRFNTTRFEVT